MRDSRCLSDFDCFYYVYNCFFQPATGWEVLDSSTLTVPLDVVKEVGKDVGRVEGIGENLHSSLKQGLVAKEREKDIVLGSMYVTNTLFRRTKLYATKDQWGITGWIGKKIARKGMGWDPTAKSNIDFWVEHHLQERFRQMFMSKRNNVIGSIRSRLRRGNLVMLAVCLRY